jgi:ketosteroid isomerase-like protein
VAGKEALRAFFQEQAVELEKVEILGYSHEFKEVIVKDDWAFEWGIFHGSSRSIGGGPPVHDSSRIFRVLRRQEDCSWKVARAVWQRYGG